MEKTLDVQKPGRVAQAARKAFRAACNLAEPIAKTFGGTLMPLSERVAMSKSGREELSPHWKAVNALIRKADALDVEGKHADAAGVFADAYEIMEKEGHEGAKCVYSRMLDASARAYGKGEIDGVQGGHRKKY